jgi:hypothetical protein
VATAEFGTWGPCVGEVLDCGDAGGAPPPPTPEAGPPPPSACVPPDVNGRCPVGTPVGGISGWDGGIFSPDGGLNLPTPTCCPCSPSDCGDPSKPACCLTDVCRTTAACASCAGQQLDPACHGAVDQDCDDFPEDCDQLCCPCKPAGICQSCPQGDVPCGGVCVNATTDPSHCGACDYVCSGGQQCVSGSCQ